MRKTKTKRERPKPLPFPCHNLAPAPTSEGNVGAEFDLASTASQKTRGSEGAALDSGAGAAISKQPCWVIGQIKGLRLKVHVDMLKDGHVLGKRHVKGVPLWTVDVIKITHDSRSGVGNDDG